jgi:hypothetical protein
MHGRSWAAYRNSTNPNIGRLGGLSKLTGFWIWSWGLSVFGMAAIVVLLPAIVVPGWLATHSSTPGPPMPHRARTSPQRAEGVRVKASGHRRGTSRLLHLRHRGF